MSEASDTLTDMVINIAAQHNEDAIVKGLQDVAGVDFQTLADEGRTVGVTIEQTGDGAVYFHVTLQTFSVDTAVAQKILGASLA